MILGQRLMKSGSSLGVKSGRAIHQLGVKIHPIVNTVGHVVNTFNKAREIHSTLEKLSRRKRLQ